MVVLDIKLKGMKHTITYASKYFALTLTLDPWMGSKGLFFSSENNHVAYQINRNEA